MYVDLTCIGTLDVDVEVFGRLSQTDPNQPSHVTPLYVKCPTKMVQRRRCEHFYGIATPDSLTSADCRRGSILPGDMSLSKAPNPPKLPPGTLKGSLSLL